MHHDKCLHRRVFGPGLPWCRRCMTVAAGGVALLMLLWVGAMSPHLVHHLFDEDHEQACLMSAQASTVPCLTVTQPSLVLPRTPPLRLLVLPVAYPWVQLTAIGFPRAPPFVRV